MYSQSTKNLSRGPTTTIKISHDDPAVLKLSAFKVGPNTKILDCFPNQEHAASCVVNSHRPTRQHQIINPKNTITWLIKLEKPPQLFNLSLSPSFRFLFFYLRTFSKLRASTPPNLYIHSFLLIVSQPLSGKYSPTSQKEIEIGITIASSLTATVEARQLLIRPWNCRLIRPTLLCILQQ